MSGLQCRDHQLYLVLFVHRQTGRCGGTVQRLRLIVVAATMNGWGWGRLRDGSLLVLSGIISDRHIGWVFSQPRTQTQAAFYSAHQHKHTLYLLKSLIIALTSFPTKFVSGHTLWIQASTESRFHKHGSCDSEKHPQPAVSVLSEPFGRIPMLSLWRFRRNWSSATARVGPYVLARMLHQIDLLRRSATQRDVPYGVLHCCTLAGLNRGQSAEWNEPRGTVYRVCTANRDSRLIYRSWFCAEGVVSPALFFGWQFSTGAGLRRLNYDHDQKTSTECYDVAGNLNKKY